MAERVFSVLPYDGLADDQIPHLANYSEERAMAGSTLVARLAGMYPAVKATINNNNVASASVLPSVQATADAYRHGKHSEKRESRATK